MSAVGSAECCPRWWDTSDEVCSVCTVAVCCYPCVIGSSARKAMQPNPTGDTEDLMLNSSMEVSMLAGWCLFGDVLPCLVAICMRVSRGATVPTKGGGGAMFPNNNTGDSCVSATLAEMCPICSCSPCQFELYRRGGKPGLFCWSRRKQSNRVQV